MTRHLLSVSDPLIIHYHQCDLPIADNFRARARASVRILVYSNHNTLGISVVSRNRKNSAVFLRKIKNYNIEKQKNIIHYQILFDI